MAREIGIFSDLHKSWSNLDLIVSIFKQKGIDSALFLGDILYETMSAVTAKRAQEALKTQEKFLTKGQFPTVMIDFTPVTPNPTDQSILAAVITVQGNSVFIKMTGEKSHLIENKTKFKRREKGFFKRSFFSY